MNTRQKEEIRLRAEILEILADVYKHFHLVPKIRKAKKAEKYAEAISTIHEVESEIRRKKHEAFRKKLRKKFGKRAKPIKRKKR